MATGEQFRDLARLRLEEARALFDAGFYDGCAYLCGYAVELALKARICATLAVDEYPGKERLKGAFLTHYFDDLKLLAGLEREPSDRQPALLANWSIASKWKPEWRYEPKGTYDREEAKKILDAVGSEPDGALVWLLSPR
jgi:HEPN domain-containing protein